MDAMPASCDVAGALDTMTPATLRDLGSASLLHRRDTKYVVPASSVTELLLAVRVHYRALSIGSNRSFAYRTMYFDTPDFRLFRSVHGGHLPRHKVRVRTYLDSQEHYLEVKHRTNHGHTIKVRRAMADPVFDATLLADTELSAGLRVAPHDLHRVATTYYRRLTLLRDGHAERVTIDLDLRYDHAVRAAAFPGVAIVEVKQQRWAPSPMHDVLRTWRCRPVSLSKYGVGVALLHPHTRHNCYKPVLTLLSKVLNTASPFVDANSTP